MCRKNDRRVNICVPSGRFLTPCERGMILCTARTLRHSSGSREHCFFIISRLSLFFLQLLWFLCQFLSCTCSSLFNFIRFCYVNSCHAHAPRFSIPFVSVVRSLYDVEILIVFEFFACKSCSHLFDCECVDGVHYWFRVHTVYRPQFECGLKRRLCSRNLRGLRRRSIWNRSTSVSINTLAFNDDLVPAGLKSRYRLMFAFTATKSPVCSFAVSNMFAGDACPKAWRQS